MKCCEYRPEDRYRTAKELIRDIDALSGKLQPFELAAEIPMRRKTKNAVPVSWDLLIQREYKPKYDNIQTVYASPVTRVFRCRKCRKKFKTIVMGYEDPKDQLCPDCENTRFVKNTDDTGKKSFITYISLLAVGMLLGALISFAVFLIKKG